MDLRDVVGSYVGGQMEVQNPYEGYMYRGEISEIGIEGDKLKIEFDWVSKAKEFSPAQPVWARHKEMSYSIDLRAYTPLDVGGGEFAIHSRSSNREVVMLLPKGGYGWLYLADIEDSNANL